MLRLKSIFNKMAPAVGPIRFPLLASPAYFLASG